jgi:hypothetical protein
MFTRPWKMSMTLSRRKDPNMEFLEYEVFAYKFEAEWRKQRQRLPGALATARRTWRSAWTSTEV